MNIKKCDNCGKVREIHYVIPNMNGIIYEVCDECKEKYEMNMDKYIKNILKFCEEE